MAHDPALLAGLRETLQPLGPSLDPGDALGELVAGADIVLLGESTHGTHEFYAMRALLTRRLVEEHGFQAVAVESDWPDALRLGRFVRGETDDADGALAGYERFPRWMWRNTAIVELAEALRALNARRDGPPIGFYGLDLYSLHASMAEVLAYFARHAPEALAEARARYACFDTPHASPADYGRAAWQGVIESCEDAVVAQLVDLQARRATLTAAGGDAAEAYFEAVRNAEVVRKAEEYYRTMFRGDVISWNLRDTHMADTLDALAGHLATQGWPPKIVVWAHNSHVGDARATDVSKAGELNLGQLVRQRYGDRARNVGFTTRAGSVTAAEDWDEPPRQRRLRPPLEGSVEELFHEVAVPRFWLDLRHLGEAARGLQERRLERMIGVVYRPRSERWSHYVRCSVPAQFDAVVHLDETHALEPLDFEGGWSAVEPPETYPSAL